MKDGWDVERLKAMKYGELKELAKGLGLNAGGKTEEIRERIMEAMGEKEEPTGKGAETATVRVVEKFLDKRLNRVKDVGETYEVDGDRAVELLAAGVAEVVK